MTKSRMRIGALLAVMLIVSMALVSVVSAAEALNEETVPEIVTTELPELIAEPLPELPVNSASATEHHPYWYLIEADNKEQKTLFEYIDNSYVSKEEKQEMKKGMKDIWSRYPDQITEEDNIVLERVEIATAEYLNDVYGKKDVGAEWAPNELTTHGEMIYTSVMKRGLGTNYANIAKFASADPDSWNSGFWQSYQHYYDPLIWFGYGPINCGYRANIAKDKYSLGGTTNLELAFKNLGYASHYLSDLGNPMHTGLEIDQYQNQWIHYQYESYVSDNWDTGYDYSAIIENNNNYYVMTDPEEAAKYLARTSNMDLYELYATIYYNPIAWRTNPSVVSITDRVLLETAKHNIGLVEYMRS